jgi:hypothetical protein
MLDKRFTAFNSYPAKYNGEYGELRIMPEDGRWDLTWCLKG